MLLMVKENPTYTSTRRNFRHEILNALIPSGLFSYLTAALSLEQMEQKVSALLVAFDSHDLPTRPAEESVAVFEGKSLQDLQMHGQRLTTLADSMFPRPLSASLASKKANEQDWRRRAGQ